MIAHAARVKQVQGAQPPRHDDRARVPGTSGLRRTEFDVHHWLEHYLASDEGSDASDRLAGVPFN